MTIVVGYLWVAPPKEAVVAENGSLNWAGAEPVIGKSERVAIAFAQDLATRLQETLVGVTVGDARTAAEHAADAGLACGLDQAQVVQTSGLVDTAEAAAGVAGVCRTLGDVRAVVIGNASSDAGTQLLGPYLGGLLGWPVITNVADIKLSGDESVVDVERYGLRSQYQVAGPLVLCCAANACTPPPMALRDILMAEKKPRQMKRLGDVAATAVPGVELIGQSKLPATAREAGLITGKTPRESATQLVTELEHRGML